MSILYLKLSIRQIMIQNLNWEILVVVWKLKVLYRKFNVVIEKNFGYGIIKYREKDEFMRKNRLILITN